MSDLSPQRLIALADEIAAQAKTGTYWSKDRYDRERFEHILSLAAEILGGALGYEPDAARRWYSDEPGTLTAKVGCSVAAFDAEGRLLLVQRSDNGLWVLPGGVVEYGEAVASAATREAWEESGVVVQVRALLGVYESRRHGFSSISAWQHVSFLAHAVGGTPGPSDETLAAAFFREVEIAGLAIGPGHRDPIRDAFAARDRTIVAAYFDQ